MDLDGTRVYFGAASGSAQKALRRLAEPHVMISATTKNNRSWDGIESLFVDSGGYSLMLDAGEHPPVHDYLADVERMGADLFALQDYPCEPEILDQYGRTVADHQHSTLERAIGCLDAAEDRGLTDTAHPVAVLQGWDADDYVEHLDALRDHGCLTNHVALGSVCRRDDEPTVQRIVRKVVGALPGRCRLHAFGCKYTVLRAPDVRHVLDSVDTSAWYMHQCVDAAPGEQAWRVSARRYLDYRATLRRQFHTRDTQQSKLPTVSAPRDPDPDPDVDASTSTSD